MKRFFFICAVALAAFVACTDEDPKDDQGGDSIVGEWSGVRSPEDKGNNEAVFLHLSFKSDGSFDYILPGWEAKYSGNYTVKGNVVSLSVTAVSWLWNRENGYENAYDEYGCLFDEKGGRNANPQKVWEEKHPGEANFSMEYSITSKGNLTLKVKSGEPVGIDMVQLWFKNPNYKPTPIPRG